MTKIVILDQKLIVPNDYQQFWAHFEWFLSLCRPYAYDMKLNMIKFVDYIYYEIL